MRLTQSLEKQNKKAKEFENNKNRNVRGPIEQFQHPNTKFQKKEAEKIKGRNDWQKSSRKLPRRKGWVLPE